jgi:hypothetical protein
VSLLAENMLNILQIPLSQAGKKLKSIKAKGATTKVSTKVKKNFDRTLPNETTGQYICIQ